MSKYKYTLNDVKKNLLSIQTKLEKKDMDDQFWVIADRNDFKPIKKLVVGKGKETKTIVKKKEDIVKHMLENNTKYANKHFAKINIWFNDNLLENLENQTISDSKDKDILSISIMIYLTNSDGKLTTSSSNIWSIKLIYSLDDLLKTKFTMEDIENIMRIVKDKHVQSDLIGGIAYSDFIKILRKKV